MGCHWIGGLGWSCETPTQTQEDLLTEDRLLRTELLAKAGGGDFLRSVAEAVVQLLMETDVDGLIGAGRHERSGERTTYRNGYRCLVPERRDALLTREGEEALWQAVFTAQPGQRREFEPSSKRRKKRAAPWPSATA